MKKLLYIFSLILLLLLFSCTNEDYQDDNGLEKGELLLSQSKTSIPTTKSTSTTKATTTIALPSEMFFENWYNGNYNVDNDIQVPLDDDYVNGGTVSVPLDANTYKLYARGTSKYTYEFISADDSGNATDIKRTIDVHYYGKADIKDINDNDIDDTFTVGYNGNHKVYGNIHMEIINGPILIRFYQLCNHPEDGSTGGNPYWHKTSNKAIEYIVDIKHSARKKGNIFVPMGSNGNIPNNAYDETTRHAYKVITLYHYVYVYDLGEQNLNGEIKDKDGKLYAYAESTNLNNYGFYDFEFPDTEKSEIKISYKKCILKEYDQEDTDDYNHAIRYYLDALISGKYYRLKTNKNIYYGGWYDNRYSLNHNTNYILIYDGTYYDVYDDTGHYKTSINKNTFNSKMETNNVDVSLDTNRDWSTWFNKYWKLSNQTTPSGFLTTITSEVAKLKKYRIGVAEYDGSGTLGKTKSSSNSDPLDIEITESNTIQL